MSLEHSRSASQGVRSPSFSLWHMVFLMLLRFRGEIKGLSLTGCITLFVLSPIVPDKNCKTPAGSPTSGGSTSSGSGGLLRVPGPYKEGECITKFPVIQNAFRLTFCRSNNDCDGYTPTKAALGTVCCLRDRCICGTDADGGGCYADPQFRLGESSSSFIITVPTVTIPTVTVPTTPTPPTPTTPTPTPAPTTP
jgi:hypothetical protein